MNILISICARGGSKGVPNKNIRPLLGKPLLVHTIEQAIASKLFQVIAVSSDSRSILDIAHKAGVTELVQRPSDLATDEMGKLPVIQHCVKTIEHRKKMEFDYCLPLEKKM